MFFPEKIISIKKSDNVLEVGPGASPFPRSNVFLEKEFDADMAYKQRGHTASKELDNPINYYQGKKFPFQNEAFDYVICSHVIEHVPEEDIHEFIKELERVAHRGYIEFPNVFYELINYQDVHLWYMWFRNGKILFLKKDAIKSNVLMQIYREFFYSKSAALSYLFNEFKDFFFFGYEWHGKIEYEICDSIDQLLSNDDLEKIRFYLNKYENNASLVASTTSPLIEKKIKTYIRRVSTLLKSIKAAISSKPIQHISSSAILEPKNNIHIHPTAEIKEYCIVRSHDNPVHVGQFSQLNPFCVIYGGAGVKIGDNVMIGPHSVIAAGGHEYRNLSVPMRHAGGVNKGPIIISDDVWIGANCTITDGVIIGKGAIVGANSVVTKNIEPYQIVAGCPAKPIGNRLTSSIKENN